MKRWQQDYITCFKSGKDPETCARRCAGMPLAMVMEIIENDPEFRAAWEEVIPAGGSGDGITSTRQLTGATLEALLHSQCNDEEAAAYFGMSVDELTARIEGDERLARVYKYARTGGKAALRVAQHEKALSGDSSMLTWAGKQHLGQSDKVDVTKTGISHEGSPVTINQVILSNMTTEQLERMLDQARGIGTDLIIEGQATRVVESVPQETPASD